MNESQPRVVAIDARGYFTGGGTGRYTRNLVRELVSAPARDVALRLLISNQHQPGDLDFPVDDDARRGSLPVRVVVSRAGWMNREEENRWLEEEVADTDLFHSLTGHWLPLGVPSVATLYDLTPLVRPRLVGEQARQWGQQIADTVVRVAQLIVISHSTARDARAVIGGALPPMVMIPAAAAPNFRPGVPAGEVLAAHALQRDGFLLTVSVINPHKNLTRLIDAYAASGADCPLIVVGAHRDDTGRVRARIERLGIEDRVRLVGRVSDQELAALYGSCRAFIYPSLYEGFGLPVIEAMACGAAVVASRTSSIPEVAGDAALLADPARTRSLAAAIRRIVQDDELREGLRRRAVVRAATFSWARAAAATLRVYAGALEARAA
jgi:glycosyltransferase involved in cell wall biosynthesis